MAIPAIHESPSNSMQREYALDIEGMSCGSCVKHVTEALNTVEGVTKVDVDLQAARVRVSGQSDSQVLIASLTDAGYPAQLASPAAGTNNMKKTGCGGSGGCGCN